MHTTDSTDAYRITPADRRRSIRMAYLNGGLWGLGNGLAGSTLVFYLASSYGATGLALSWLIASPSLVGVLRLLTPLGLDQIGSRRRFCVGMFLASALVLLGLPLMSAPDLLPSAANSITALVLCWAGYLLLERFGVVALWSWFGDLVPQRIRGRFVGCRSSWMNTGRVSGMVIAAVGTYAWRQRCTRLEQMDQLWQGYAVSAVVGSLFLAAAAWPLMRMTDLPSPSDIGDRSPRVRLRELARPFADARFLRLLLYGSWFSFANGISDTAVRVFQVSVLNLSFAEKRTLDASSRGIQSLLMPWVGAQADRRGSVPVLVISQGLVAAALLFLLIASAEAKWWIIGTYVLWIAYAGANVARPNLMLRLSDPKCSAAYTAAWFAWTQLVYALSAVAGGVLFDWMREHWQTVTWGSWQIDYFAALFVAGWLLRSLAMWPAARIQEWRRGEHSLLVPLAKP